MSLTIAVNGYDDGKSTGEVRRFLGDSLGPSDYRKNASRLASELKTASPALVGLLESRLASQSSVAEIRADVFAATSGIDAAAASRVSQALDRFFAELETSGRPFDFDDCSVGNLVFAGLYLEAGRSFNAAVDHYAVLLGLPEGLIENVTAGENAWLVALGEDSRLLATEAEIVDQERPNRIKDIYLLDRPLTPDEIAVARASGGTEQALQSRRATVSLNPRLAPKLAAADLIIYAPGTQHSSLFPSYLTPGLNAAIAANLHAIKLLVTNIQADAEISGSSAVDLIDRAVYYLTERGRLATPVPCLITHYLVNEPGHSEPAAPYVPLGPVEGIEDPRLVRVGNYEEGVSGRHDAARVLAPFLQSIVSGYTRRRVAMLLHDAGGSANKVAETLLEMVRGGVERIPIDMTVFYSTPAPLDPSFAESLPFHLEYLQGGEGMFVAQAAGRAFDYVVLFESSGMYRGEDVAAVLTHLPAGRLDAVWGSRRLSVRDIEESYRFRYRKNVLLGAISYAGSYLLSLAYLVLYGRYVSDTLSAVRAVRAGYVFGRPLNILSRDANHVILSALLRDKSELLEIPVRFVPLSPDRVKRTSVGDGLRALGTIVRRRFGGAA